MGQLETVICEHCKRPYLSDTISREPCPRAKCIKDRKASLVADDFDETEEGFSSECWCSPGEKNCWFSTADLDETCGGLGTLHCHCGGDLCICHNHGEVECDGCEDCDLNGDDWPDHANFDDED